MDYWINSKNCKLNFIIYKTWTINTQWSICFKNRQGHEQNDVKSEFIYVILQANSTFINVEIVLKFYDVAFIFNFDAWLILLYAKININI